MTSKQTPEMRRETILTAAITCARMKGYQHMTREEIAAAAECSTGLVTKHLGTMIQLRRSVMRAAVKEGVLEIVAQGLASRDPHARKAPDELKTRALQSIAA